MSLKDNPGLSDLLDQIRSCLGAGEELHLVGGAVRDLLMGRELHDLDFVMPGNPTGLAKCIARSLGAGSFVLDDERHTARVMYFNSGIDFFPLDFVQYTGSSLEEDLRNRDFTVNAMAIPIGDMSTIIDPFGGQQDLEKKVLRACLHTSLLDDPVRVLRAVRFAIQLNFHMDADLEDLILQAVPHLPETSIERQRDELFRILEGSDPALGMTLLNQFHLFTELIPPLVEQESIPASPPHVLPLFDHTLATVGTYGYLLKNLQQGTSFEETPAWWMRAAVSELLPFKEEIAGYFSEEITPGRKKHGLALFGALLHDIGKPRTMELGEDGRMHYFEHDLVGAELAWEAAKRLQLSNAESTWVSGMVQNHMALLPLVNAVGMPGRASVYRFFKEAGDAGVAIAILLLADTASTYSDDLTESVWEKTLAVSKAMLEGWFRDRDTVISPALFLNGNDLQKVFKLKPGKHIGQLLAALEEVQAGGVVSTHEEALDFIRGRLSEGQNEEGLA